MAVAGRPGGTSPGDSRADAELVAAATEPTGDDRVDVPPGLPPQALAAMLVAMARASQGARRHGAPLNNGLATIPAWHAATGVVELPNLARCRLSLNSVQARPNGSPGVGRSGVTRDAPAVSAAPGVRTHGAAKP